MREQIWGAYDWAERARKLEDEFTRIVAPFQRSAFLYELGQLHEYMTPDRERALWPYGRAWSATGSHTPALERARSIYRELGRLDMVAELALVEFKQTTEPDFLALAGEALVDARLPERARGPLRTALEFRPHDVVLRDTLAIAEIDEAEAEAEIASLELEAAARDADLPTRSRLRLRVARILWQLMPEDPRCGEALKRAFATDPEDERLHVLAQLYFERSGQLENLVELFEREASLADSIYARVDTLRNGGTSLAVRFHAPELANRLLRQALALAHDHAIPEVPGHLAMLRLLRDAQTQGGNLEEVVHLGDQALLGPRTEDEQLSLALFAGETAWKYLGDLEAARGYFDRVGAIVNDHPRLVEFTLFGRSSSTPSRDAAQHVERPERITRYSLPVGVRQLDAEQMEIWGYTRDFHEAGVFVMTDRSPPMDEWVVLQLRVPGPADWEIHVFEVEALVVRVETGIGFAAQIVDSDEEFVDVIGRLKRAELA